jgi:subtilisin
MERTLKWWSFFLAFTGVFWAVNALSQTISIPVVSDQLVLKAQTEGTVRVIVQVSVPFQVEGNLINSLAVASQRKGIATAQDRLFKELQSTKYRITRLFETIPFVALEAGIQALAAVERSGLVISVEEDRLSSPMLSESVPLVEGNQAWAKGFDGNGWTVAVLDTGVDKTHSFLSGKVVAEACFSGNGNCPNGETTQIGSGAGIPCTYAAGACQHGTHVAGIAAGSGSSLSGVAKRANIIAIQVFSEFTGENCAGAGEDPCAAAWDSDWVAALEHVFKLRSSFSIAAANMSLGGIGFLSQTTCNAANPSAKAAIDNLRSAGIATVASSGNDGYTNAISHPACISSAVSVGSTSKTDQVSLFSNSASFLSLLAPGESIYSSIPGGEFAYKNGTSMAAPHVAGTWAIMKQKTPLATVDSVLSALKTTGLPVTDPWNDVTTPRIRIDRALNSFVSSVGDAIIGVFRPSTGRWYIDLDGNGTWSGCGPDGCWGIFGSRGDLPVAGEWDGNGKSRIGVFRSRTGMWYLDTGNGIWDGCETDLCIGHFGSSGDLPVAGDWTNTGQTSIGVYRPRTGMWYLDTGNGIWDGCGIDLCIGPFGLSGDFPVAGDWTNTGQTMIGVYRHGTRMWYLDTGNGIWDGCGIDLCIGPFGSSGDLPVAGDWTRSGTTTIGVYRPGTGMWYLDTGNGTWDGCGIDFCLGPFGFSGDLPVAGVW